MSNRLGNSHLLFNCASWYSIQPYRLLYHSTKVKKRLELVQNCNANNVHHGSDHFVVYFLFRFGEFLGEDLKIDCKIVLQHSREVDNTVVFAFFGSAKYFLAFMPCITLQWCYILFFSCQIVITNLIVPPFVYRYLLICR